MQHNTPCCIALHLWLWLHAIRQANQSRSRVTAMLANQKPELHFAGVPLCNTQYNRMKREKITKTTTTIKPSTTSWLSTIVIHTKKWKRNKKRETKTAKILWSNQSYLSKTVKTALCLKGGVKIHWLLHYPYLSHNFSKNHKIVDYYGLRICWHCCYCCWRASVLCSALWACVCVNVLMCVCTVLGRIPHTVCSICALHVYVHCIAQHFHILHFMGIHTGLSPSLSFFIWYFFLPLIHSLSLIHIHSLTDSLALSFSFCWANRVCRFYFILALLAANVVILIDQQTNISHGLRKQTLLLSLHMTATK